MAESKSLRIAYGEALAELGAENDKIVVLDADLSNATMTNRFSAVYPDRFFDVGIAEEHALTIFNGFPEILQAIISLTPRITKRNRTVKFHGKFQHI